MWLAGATRVLPKSPRSLSFSLSFSLSLPFFLVDSVGGCGWNARCTMNKKHKESTRVHKYASHYLHAIFFLDNRKQKLTLQALALLFVARSLLPFCKRGLSWVDAHVTPIFASPRSSSILIIAIFIIITVMTIVAVVVSTGRGLWTIQMHRLCGAERRAEIGRSFSWRLVSMQKKNFFVVVLFCF